MMGPGFRLAVTEDYKNREYKVEIGDNVVFNDQVHIGCANRITTVNNVLIASEVYITDHNHGYYDAVHKDKHESPDIPPLKRRLTEDGIVEIGENACIGESQVNADPVGFASCDGETRGWVQSACASGWGVSFAGRPS